MLPLVAPATDAGAVEPPRPPNILVEGGLGCPKTVDGCPNSDFDSPKTVLVAVVGANPVEAENKVDDESPLKRDFADEVVFGEAVFPKPLKILLGADVVLGDVLFDGSQIFKFSKSESAESDFVLV